MAVVRFIVFSNLWIAAAAISLTYATNELAGIAHSPWLMVFLGGSTLCAYSFLRLSGMDRHAKPSGELATWVARYSPVLWMLTVGGAILGFIAFWMLSITSMIIAASTALLTIFYVIPFWPSGGKIVALRELPYLKLWAIALVWMATTVWLPLTEGGFQWSEPLFRAFSLERLFTVAAMCIPFDIRDIRRDDAMQRTIPQALGIRGAKILGTVLTLLASVFFYRVILLEGDQRPWPWMAVGVYLLFIALLWGSKVERRELYYTGLVDGVLVLQAVIWILTF